MRGLAVVVGSLLLVGGGALVVVADQQRAAAVADIEAQIAHLEKELQTSRDDNLHLAEQLTALRSQIAEQDAEIADTTGFLK